MAVEPPVEPPKPKPFWRRWRKTTGVVVALLITAGYLLVMRLSQHVAVKAELDSIRAAGYPASLREANDWYAKVPHDNNAAILLVDVYHMFDQDAGESINLGELQLPAPDQPMTPELRKRLDVILHDTIDARRAIHLAAKKTASRYPIDLARINGSGGPNGRGVAIRLEGVMAYEAMVAIDDGRIDDAVDTIEATMGIARSMDTAPMDLAAAMRVYVESEVIKLINRLLIHRQLNHEQLMRLVELLLKAGHTPHMSRVVPSLRAFVSTVLLEPETQMDVTATQRILNLILGAQEKIFLNSAPYLKSYVEASTLDPISRLIRFREIDEERAANPEKLRDDGLFLFTMIAAKDAEHYAHLQVVYGALMVEDYRAVHGRLPPDLAALVPEICTEIPYDECTAKPLIYKPRTNGYTIYSVGLDGQDDGGGVKAKPSSNVLDVDKQFEPGVDITFTVDR